jgi:hypothetical protein
MNRRTASASFPISGERPEILAARLFDKTVSPTWTSMQDKVSFRMCFADVLYEAFSNLLNADVHLARNFYRLAAGGTLPGDGNAALILYC